MRNADGGVIVEEIQKERRLGSGYRRCLAKAMGRTHQLLREEDAAPDYERIHSRGKRSRGHSMVSIPTALEAIVLFTVSFNPDFLSLSSMLAIVATFTAELFDDIKRHRLHIVCSA